MGKYNNDVGAYVRIAHDGQYIPTQEGSLRQFTTCGVIKDPRVVLEMKHQLPQIKRMDPTCEKTHAFQNFRQTRY